MGLGQTVLSNHKVGQPAVPALLAFEKALLCFFIKFRNSLAYLLMDVDCPLTNKNREPLFASIAPGIHEVLERIGFSNAII